MRLQIIRLCNDARRDWAASDKFSLDPKFLTEQLHAMLAKRDAKQLRKTYRVLGATLEP